MLGFLKDVANALLGGPDSGSTTEEPAERRDRDSERFAMGGHTVVIGAGDAKSELRLKNLSTGGASGITPLPVAIGGMVSVAFPDGPRRTALVRWVDSTTVGLKFVKPLDLSFLVRLYLTVNGVPQFSGFRRQHAGPWVLPAVANEN